ncbi:hypothetical protein H0H92_004655 [Tricholoma furcatifolium]|nr:hypothetical protein H0H92_004655 [Tricholoma furcatifolium]
MQTQVSKGKSEASLHYFQGLTVKINRKPVPIQGTNLILDKPEDIEAWLAERKRRWPTTQRVEEKKRKMDEAISRGQLPEPLERFKRRKTDDQEISYHDRGRGRGRGRGNSSRGRGRVADAGWQGRTPSNIKAPAMSSPNKDSSDSEDDDEIPETVSSKAPLTSHIPLQQCLPGAGLGTQRTSNDHKHSKRPPPQPRKEPYNPFASRPTLLRNLLLPEIRVTISNLSQAIRFLVDNEFLEGVELTPGAAEAQPIQVIANDDVSVTS